MIDKPVDVINAYLSDSQNKEIVIEHEGIDYDSINYYIGDIDGNLHGIITTMGANNGVLSFISNLADMSHDFKPFIHLPITNSWDYLFFFIDFMLVSVQSGISMLSWYTYTVRFYYDQTDPTKYVSKTKMYIPNNVDLYVRQTFALRVNKTDADIDKIVGAWKIEQTMSLFSPSSVTSGAKVQWRTGAPRVFYSNSLDVNAKWEPAPDFDRLSRSDLDYVIGNEKLLLGNFELTESLCSQDNVKFGLCEAAHCKFSCVTSDVPKIGDKISVASKLPGVSTLPSDKLILINWALKSPLNGFDYTYTNYDPYFQLNICPDGMADWSDYVDKLNLTAYVLHIAFDLRFTFTNVTGTIPTYFRVIEEVDYNGVPSEITSVYYNVSDYFFTFTRHTMTNLIYTENRTLRAVSRIRVKFFDENYNAYSLGNTKCTYEVETTDWQFAIGENSAIVPPFDRGYMLAANKKLDAYIALNNNVIPLGIFYIDSVSKNYRHNVVEKSITAYDNMLVLEQNAADWYTSYMFGLDSDDWISNGFEFARQIYSSYSNYVMYIGLDSRSNYVESEIASYTYADITASHLSSKYKTWVSSGLTFKIRYAVFTINDPDTSHLYMVKCMNTNGVSDETIINNYIGSYKTAVDSLGRGVCTNGGVLVVETRDNGTTAGFCINRGDYFMISPNCTSFKVYIAAQTKDGSTVVNHLVDEVTLYEVESAPRLVNGYLRLCYYNYGTKDIFACDSSITGRDVVRSLLEVCGCFFRLNRFNGLPEFVYPTKGGLYPSNTLFPADDLYPRSGTDGLYPMGRYSKTIAEDYEVLDYGRIQILKNARSNDAVSVCEWQYDGNPDAANTYIIDDNIFYCADDMLYDYDSMPEVSQMLSGMYNTISNLGYVPNVTDAIGSPWLECGDRLGLLTYDGGFETFIFRRTLKGIQNLFDTYESVGDEKNDAIDNYGY